LSPNALMASNTFLLAFTLSEYVITFILLYIEAAHLPRPGMLVRAW